MVNKLHEDTLDREVWRNIIEKDSFAEDQKPKICSSRFLGLWSSAIFKNYSLVLIAFDVY